MKHAIAGETITSGRKGNNGRSLYIGSESDLTSSPSASSVTKTWFESWLPFALGNGQAAFGLECFRELSLVLKRREHLLPMLTGATAQTHLPRNLYGIADAAILIYELGLG